MTFRNTTRSWGSLSKALHWLIVLLIINQWCDRGAGRGAQRDSRNSKRSRWHKSFGMTILMLAVVAAGVALVNPVPDLTTETKPWERVLAKISHVLLYALHLRDAADRLDDVVGEELTR